MVGLLLPVRAVLITLVLSILTTLLVPTIGMYFTVTVPQALAIALMVIAAGIASQTSGEVYGIAQWALESYSKERALKDKLFDSQEELNRSYVRQKVLADDLQKTNVELEAARAAALEAKNFRGQFLANMSHELRTPLNAVIGFSETMLNFPMMYDNQELPPAYKTDLSQIYNSGKHLLQLINDILDLSKVDAGRLEMEIEAVDLDPIFKGVLSTAIGLVGDKPIKIKREAPEGHASGQGRLAAHPPGDPEPVEQRSEIHRQGHDQRRRSHAGRRVCAHLGEGHGHRHPVGRYGEHLRGVPPGRQRPPQGARRVRPGTGHLAPIVEPDGRPDLGREPDERRQHLQFHASRFRPGACPGCPAAPATQPVGHWSRG